MRPNPSISQRVCTGFVSFHLSVTHPLFLYTCSCYTQDVHLYCNLHRLLTTLFVSNFVHLVAITLFSNNIITMGNSYRKMFINMMMIAMDDSYGQTFTMNTHHTVWLYSHIPIEAQHDVRKLTDSHDGLHKINASWKGFFRSEDQCRVLLSLKVSSIKINILKLLSRDHK